ncbi:uncharacterized protein LOC133033262 [Cannabis sativa]|uniref:uncharacterized protein LOC133033262 n=1 Tax=Cannabis sativa TaxID=3483 RepID=UPI0029C9C5F2|nr:uncharacterized protein LOC133033262 [Cannabis sativa]
MVCQSKFVGGLGFKSLAHFNQAMLAKQAWRILKYPNPLLSSILKARYFSHTSILDVGPGHSPSYSWRSILWGRDLMKQGLIWKVGNGNTVRTIEDHWLPDFRIKSYSSPPPSDILNVPISGNNCQDDLFWSRNNSGLFSVKTAYRLTLTSRDIPSSSSFRQSKHFWSRIWSSSAPPKVRHLVWRVLSSSIPVASSLFHRRIIPSPICPICHMKWETVEHTILECSGAKKAWKHSQFFDFYVRNKRLNIYDFIVQAIDLYDKYNVYSPPTGCWKINTDAGIRNTAKKHSLGIVVRDDCDNIKAGLIVPIVGLVPPEVAEAKAILTALSWLQATKLPVTVL